MARRPITNPVEYLNMALRRWYWVAVPFVLISAATYVIAHRLPKLYRSDALIVVEPQKVPADYVKPTVSSNVALRLQSIQEDILSRTQLAQIINKYGLYRNLGLTPDQQVGRMMDQIKVAPIIDPDQRNADVTAFHISFQDHTPLLAQQVASDLSNLFIQKNLSLRAQQSVGTETFIDGRLQQAQQQLTTMQNQLRQVKNQYMGSLPEQEGANLQVMNQLNSALQTNNDALARAQQQRTYLLSLGEAVANLNPVQRQAIAAAPNPLEATLKQAQTQLAVDLQLYTPQYPEVIRLQAQIKALKEQLKEAAPPAKTAAAVTAPPSKTPAAGPSAHPAAATVAAKTAAPEVAPNPSTDAAALAGLPLQQRSEVNLLNKEIARYESEGKAIQKKIAIMQARIEQLPEVEEKMANIVNANQVAQATYNGLLEKKAAASTAAAMEQQAEGQEFRIVDPANLPEVPTSPNLPRIYLMGSMGGLLLGLGLAFAAEMRDPVLRGELDLTFYTQAPLLAVLPLLPQAPPPATLLPLPPAETASR